MARSDKSKTVVYAALAGNLLIAVTKFGAAAWTGSSAMLSEAVHSLVDTGNELLLLYGMRRSEVPPDSSHPQGHGREVYFWTFVVALLIFSVGACISAFEGVAHILRPAPVEHAMVSYAVLLVSAAFEGTTWFLAFREVRSTKGGRGYIKAVQDSKDPTTFTVLLEDSAALLGIAIAAVGIASAQWLDWPQLDGVASIGIAIILAVTAMFLATETKGLLIGEAADPALQESLLRLADGIPDIERANGVTTVHLAPRQIVAAFSLDFVAQSDAHAIEAAVLALEERVRAQHPDVSTIYVKPQSAHVYRERLTARREASREDRPAA